MLNIIKNKKYSFISIIIILLSFNIMACDYKNNDSMEKEVEDKKELRVALSVDPGLDVIDNTDTSSNTLIQAHTMIYEGLVSYGDKGEIEPALATDWDISEDGKEYTFYLRENVEFTDGTKFNSEAVKFSFDRWINNPMHSNINIAGLLDSIEILDEYTIKFLFKENYYPLLTEFTYPRPVRIMSPTSVDPVGDINGELVKPIGTGQWIVEDYIKDKESTLVANDNYWGGKSSLDKIIFKVIPDSQTRNFAMKNGEIDLQGDVLSSVSIDSLHSISNEENIKILNGDSTTSYLALMNYENKILKDKNVRKAINYAIDPNLIVNDLMDGIGKPAKGMFQKNVPYTTEENSKWYDHDLKKAEELLKKSGYEEKNTDGYLLGSDGNILELNLVFSDQEYTEWKIIAEYMQAALKDIGIKINLNNMEINSYYDSLWENKDYDLIIYRTYSDSWNPHGFLLSLFKNSEESSGVAWSDENLDVLIDNAIISDQEARQEKYDELYDYIYKEAIFMPLYYPDSIFLIRDNIDNIKFGPDSYKPFIWEDIIIK